MGYFLFLFRGNGYLASDWWPYQIKETKLRILYSYCPGFIFAVFSPNDQMRAKSMTQISTYLILIINYIINLINSKRNDSHPPIKSA